jgi:hypothetical protein
MMHCNTLLMFQLFSLVLIAIVFSNIFKTPSTNGRNSPENHQYWICLGTLGFKYGSDRIKFSYNLFYFFRVHNYLEHSKVSLRLIGCRLYSIHTQIVYEDQKQ